jgi:CDP-diacylglycerol--serine O-phosphatidyltransferase
MDLSKAKYLVPNSLTLASVYCGMNSIYLSTTAQSATEMMMAAWLLVIAMVCDGLDGRVARMTRAESELGVQLDSLADMVSFGVAPGFLLFNWGMQPLGKLGLFFGFVYAASTALRLARFNVMAAQHTGVLKYFMGLPSPLAAGTVVAVVLAHVSVTGEMTTGASASVAALGVLLGGLMISNVRYRTFKDVNFRGRAGAIAIGIAGLTAAVAMAFKPGVAFVLLMMLYIAIGIVGGLVNLSRAILGEDDAEFETSEEFVEED